MNFELQQIAERIKELRDILEITPEAMSEKLSMPLSEYEAYERGEKDFSISMLYQVSGVFGVDMTVILTGEEPHMNSYTVMRKGQGMPVERFSGYSYSSLAYNFAHKSMEPLMVTLEPDLEENHKLVTHGGQEFNFVIHGKVRVIIGKREFVLEEGDSIYFDPRLPHGQFAVDEMAQFLTVIDE